jgi:SPP1 gp7 family putative phage head morphogenesis protein
MFEEGIRGSGFVASILGFGNDVDSFNNKQWNKFSKMTIGSAFDPDDPKINKLIEAWTQEQLTLIKGLQDEYIKDMSGIISRGVQQGRPSGDIMKDLLEKNKTLTRSRAELIARNEVGNLQAALTQERQTSVGLDMYIWVTAGDKRVRTPHKVMANKLCRWDDPTVYSVDGGKTWIKRPSNAVRLHPGQDIRCRCTAVPYFEEMKKEVDNEIIEEEKLAV